jgi:DNA polymerase-1
VINQKHLSILEEIKKSGGKVDSGEPNDSVLLIDGLNTFIRVFSAIPTTNEDGVHIGGIVGFLRSIGYTINMVRPTRTIIVFDGKGGSNRRRKIFPQYKMGRKMSHRLNRAHDFLTREEEKKMMIFQLNRCVEYLECLPLTIINMDNIEADDVIGYCAKHIFDKKSTIMSTDKDFLQLIDENIRVYSPTKKKMYDEEKIVEEYGISSHNF